ncbi:urease accessory protein UreD [Hyphococcus sp. DH-69]|uniref:urease accessory protein UreD n=1 Tax=Hyphococcus formosus TaxID=3143534 RepID=UPI00398AFE93
MQCDTKLERTYGSGELFAQYTGVKTSIAKLSQDGAAKIRFPQQFAQEPLSSILINTAGGMTSGDKLNWTARAQEDSSLTLSTQACEKIYRGNGGAAEISIHLTAEKNAQLYWLPQETILYDHSHLKRTLTLDVHSGARALITEAFILGRQAFGETRPIARLDDKWRIYSGGDLIHAEQIKINTAHNNWFENAATANSHTAFATLLFVGENLHDHFAQLQSKINAERTFSAHCSAWTIGNCDKFCARIAASDGYQLRKILTPLVTLLSGEDRPPALWLT